MIPTADRSSGTDTRAGASQNTATDQHTGASFRTSVAADADSMHSFWSTMMPTSVAERAVAHDIRHCNGAVSASFFTKRPKGRGAELPGTSDDPAKLSWNSCNVNKVEVHPLDCFEVDLDRSEASMYEELASMNEECDTLSDRDQDSCDGTRYTQTDAYVDDSAMQSRQSCTERVDRQSHTDGMHIDGTPCRRSSFAASTLFETSDDTEAGDDASTGTLDISALDDIINSGARDELELNSLVRLEDVCFDDDDDDDTVRNDQADTASGTCDQDSTASAVDRGMARLQLCMQHSTTTRAMLKAFCYPNIEQLRMHGTASVPLQSSHGDGTGEASRIGCSEKGCFVSSVGQRASISHSVRPRIHATNSVLSRFSDIDNVDRSRSVLLEWMRRRSHVGRHTYVLDRVSLSGMPGPADVCREGNRMNTASTGLVDSNGSRWRGLTRAQRAVLGRRLKRMARDDMSRAVLLPSKLTSRTPISDYLRKGR